MKKDSPELNYTDFVLQLNINTSAMTTFLPPQQLKLFLKNLNSDSAKTKGRQLLLPRLARLEK
jgi:hypothetical protein